MMDVEAQAVDIYNQSAARVGWPQARLLTKTRRAKIKARLAECGGIEGWKVAMEKAEASPLCTGDNNRGWVADLDFFCQQRSFVRLMEGSYDTKRPKRQTGSMIDRV